MQKLRILLFFNKIKYQMFQINFILKRILKSIEEISILMLNRQMI